MFRRMTLTLAASLSLAACNPGGMLSGIPPTPSEASDRTTLDERALLGLELSYQAARTATELAVDAGAIKGATATRVAKLDRDAYSALKAARDAYGAANASSYGEALERARTAVSGILGLVKGGGR